MKYNSPVENKKQTGRIINIASLGAVENWTGYIPYSLAKSGVHKLTQQLGKKLAPYILVNAIAPGFLLTKQNESLLRNPDGSLTPRSLKILNSTPMGRFGEPEELLGALLFLVCEEASSFVNGVVIPIDGGFSAYSGV